MTPELEAVLCRINPPSEIKTLEDLRGVIHSADRYSLVERRFYEEVVQVFADIAAGGVAGDILAAGVWKGGSAVYLQALNRHFHLNKRLWLSDTFSGFVRDNIQHKKDLRALRLMEMFVGFEQPEHSLFPGVAEVKQLFHDCSLWDELVNIIPGPLEVTLRELDLGRLCFVHVDVDLYEPTKAALEIAYPKLEPGGYVVVDDYGVEQFNCKEAVDEFRAEHGITAPMRFMTSYAVCWKKLDV
jgi:O-methyltransferase